ncbi:UBX domain-containing protein 6-like [Sycon ciliatum]|uniref:UBX domain-containing protein 6-like n=1 Tax=Sycon ciliatum TaxID=27933 RepID=UPI0031F620A1
MDKIKSFFEEKKLDSKFKKAGEGHRLDAAPSQQASSAAAGAAASRAASASAGSARAASAAAPSSASASGGQPRAAAAAAAAAPASEASTAAAVAALSRHEQHQRNTAPITGTVFRRKASSEASASASASSSGAAATAAENPVDPAVRQRNANITGLGGGDSRLFPVKLICPMCGESFGRQDRQEHLEKCFREELPREPLVTSAFMLFTMTRNSEKLQACVETIRKYLNNIIMNPTEAKYGRIRLQNAVVRDRVVVVPGALEFLDAVKFKLHKMSKDGEAPEEDFLVMEEADRGNSDMLTVAMEILENTKPLKVKLDRCFQVLRVSQRLTQFPLPAAFFRMTAEELKREQARRKQEVETLSTLRTQAMRDRDTQAALRTYRYCVLRVRFHDGAVLQAMFYPNEMISDVRLAINSALREELQNAEFVMIDPRGRPVKDEMVTLSAAHWVPHALITVHFVKHGSGLSPEDTRFLRVELMMNIVSDY